MLNSFDKSQLNQDERINEEEDSLIMTIEYLRARLLSERSISKAAKERADELVERVEGLEEQLKVVTSQRKRAEKAALDVLSYLDSLGINENLEDYECDSKEEESECEEDKNSESSERKKNGKESSGSEHESTTPSSPRSLSWKGRKESTRVLDKKGFSSSMRARSGLAQLQSVPRHRLGKSCRQIRRRELRLTNVELNHDKSDAQNNNFAEGPNHCQDCLEFRSGKLKRSPERKSERSSQKEEVSHSFQAEAQECDASSSTHERESTGEMERALQHQAQLIRSYEAQEKAQRDWEEKNGDNNDSCEPGSHSDVTEERDENKSVIPQPIKVDPHHSHDDKIGMETNSRGEKRPIIHFNSFKIITPDSNIESSEKHKFSDKLSTSPDFAFFATDNNKSLEHASHNNSSQGGSDFYQPRPPIGNTIVPHKEPEKLGSVLEALQEAKQAIQRHMNSSSEKRESVGKEIQISDPINTDFDWLKLPVRCPGLFRVPTEHDGQSSNSSRSLSLNYSSDPTSSTTFNVSNPTGPPHGFSNGPSVSPPGFRSELEISNRQPIFEFPYRSSNQISSQFQGNEDGEAPFGYPSFRPNAYR